MKPIKFDLPEKVLEREKGSTIAPKLHFQRFEMKYVIPTEMVDAVREYIRSFMEKDPSLAPRASTYDVHSLYFDSPLFYYFSQKMDGVRKRKKIRLRVYRTGPDFSPNAFFEIKRKNDVVVLKDRFIFEPKRLPGFLETLEIESLFAGPLPDLELAEEYREERMLRSIQPVSLNVYTREPLLGRFNKNIRVTFDSNIRTTGSDSLFYEGQDFVSVSPGFTVMEVKFTGSLPFYIVDAIRRFSLSATSYSKYCQGMIAYGKILPHTPLIYNHS